VLANVSALRRYVALNEQILRLRAGRPIQLEIDADEPLRISHADVMLEAATTATHVRIEHRVLPAGPSLLDMVANAAFYVRLVSALATLSRPVEAHIPFADVREAFYAAARRGLDARIAWLDGRLRPVRSLILDELLPMARRGLRGHGVDAEELERWLGILEQRVRTRRIGSVWQRGFIERHGRDFQSMLADYLEHQRSGAPVHEWPS
jgi:hypothetical protein